MLLTAALPRSALAGLRRVDPRLNVVQMPAAETAFFATVQRLQDGASDRLRRSVVRRLARAEILITFPQSPVDLSSNLPRCAGSSS